MATKTETIFRTFDDLTGEELSKDDLVKIQFSYEGNSYSLDLSKANAKTFKDFLKPYTKNPVSTKGGKSSSSNSRPGALAWAKENGHVAPTHRGRLPQTALDAYDAAH